MGGKREREGGREEEEEGEVKSVLRLYTPHSTV